MADVGFVKSVLDAIGSALGPIGDDLRYIWDVWQETPIESAPVKAQAGNLTDLVRQGNDPLSRLHTSLIALQGS